MDVAPQCTGGLQSARNVGILIGKGKTAGNAFSWSEGRQMVQSLSFRHYWSLPALLCLFIVSSLPAQAPASGVIDVTITGVRVKQGGELIVALYDRPGGWLELDSARSVRRLPVTNDTIVTVVFDSLPPDSAYAIGVIHDKNGNDKMDMRWFPFPKPKEGAGVSQNHTRAGKPEYDKARVPVGEAIERITIEMKY